MAYPKRKIKSKKSSSRKQKMTDRKSIACINDRQQGVMLLEDSVDKILLENRNLKFENQNLKKEIEESKQDYTRLEIKINKLIQKIENEEIVQESLDEEERESSNVCVII